MTLRRKRIFKPFPELVEPDAPGTPWKIADSNTIEMASNGAVHHGERWIGVPLEPAGRPVARHELAHVAWSPPRLPRVRFDERVLAVVEDARINRGLDALGIPVHLDEEMRAHVRMLAARDAKHGDGFAMVGRAVASLGTDVEPDLVGLLESEPRIGPFALECVGFVRTALARAEARSADGVASFAAGHRTARRLARLLRASGFLDGRGRAQSGLQTGCCVMVRADDGEDGASADGPGGQGGAPGPMVTVRAAMPVRLRSLRGGGRRWGAAREGSVVRYVGRWPSDKAIFRRRRAGRGGASVLIDTSGSMSIETDDLDRLLTATPAGARVAIYSANRREGELRLVAHGSRRAVAADLEPFGRGNVVDVPALEWLARQPEPRFWVSDGKVTGIGDRQSDEVEARASEICRSARIERVDTLEAATRRIRA